MTRASADAPPDLLAQTHEAGRLLAHRTDSGRDSVRIGTWNLDARHQPAHVELALQLGCDVLLLTEISPRLEIPGYTKVLTAGVMARGQHWAGVFSRRPLEPLPEPHPASAAARIDGPVFCSSILPWTGCGAGEPWGNGGHADRTRRTLERLRPGLSSDGVWGGDWNHALVGRERAGSLAGRAAVQHTLEELGLQVPTAELAHQRDGLCSIDHIAVPGSWRVLSVEQASVAVGDRWLSDHDAYVVEVIPAVTDDRTGSGPSRG